MLRERLPRFYSPNVREAKFSEIRSRGRLGSSKQFIPDSSALGRCMIRGRVTLGGTLPLGCLPVRGTSPFMPCVETDTLITLTIRKIENRGVEAEKFAPRMGA
jgi:hypothetical protein